MKSLSAFRREIASLAIEKLEAIWKKYSASPFEFTFLDQNIDSTFRAEMRLGKIVLMFTVLTIIIACLGLFGSGDLPR